MKNNLKLFIVSALLLPALALIATSQEVQLKKYVIGAGGMNDATVTNDNGTTITHGGTVAQTSVQIHTALGSAGPVETLYEGFWGPTKKAITSVELPDMVSNDRLNNFPNPFTTNTTIKFSVENNSKVTLRVFDMNGSIVANLFEGTVMGEKSVEWDGTDQTNSKLSSGSYLYELNVEPVTGGRSYSLRNVMVLTK